MPPGHVEVLIQLNQEATHVTAPSGVVNPICQGQLGGGFFLLLYNGLGKDSGDL